MLSVTLLARVQAGRCSPNLGQIPQCSNRSHWILHTPWPRHTCLVLRSCFWSKAAASFARALAAAFFHKRSCGKFNVRQVTCGLVPMDRAGHSCEGPGSRGRHTLPACQSCKGS